MSTYKQLAKLQWPKAVWIDGNGRYASVAHCRSLTVNLCETLDRAKELKSTIDATGCGGACAREPRIKTNL